MKRTAAEKNFENRVKKFLKDEGCWFIKYWGGGGFTKSGIPDLLVCCDGAFLAVELKAENGKPSELQFFNLMKIEDAGGFGWLLYPNKFEEFKKFVRNINSRDAREIYEKSKGWAEV